MYVEYYTMKKGVYASKREFPSFKNGIKEIENELPAIEAENGVFNCVAVVSKSESSDLLFIREKVVIQEIETKYESFPVLTYAMVGYDLLDSKQLVIFNKTHQKALEFYLKSSEVVFRSADLYNSLNDEESRVLRRQRALRHGTLSNSAETTSEVGYAIENGYLEEFVENNAGEVWNWSENQNPDFSDEKESIYGFDDKIKAIIELLRAEDNSMSSKTTIDDYLCRDTGFDHLKCSKSKYNTREGVVGLNKASPYSKEQIAADKSRKALFKAKKAFNRKTDAKFKAFKAKTSSEALIRAVEGVKYRSPVMRTENKVLRQLEQSEEVFRAESLNLLSVAENIASEAVNQQIADELASVGDISIGEAFVNALYLYKKAERQKAYCEREFKASESFILSIALFISREVFTKETRLSLSFIKAINL